MFDSVIPYKSSAGKAGTSGFLMLVLLLTATAPTGPRADTDVQASASVAYQGRLLDGDGKPLSGEHELEFNLYDGADSLLWGPFVFDLVEGAPEQQGHGTRVTLVNGVFSVVLEEMDEDDRSISAAFGKEETYTDPEDAYVYLDLKIDGVQPNPPRRQRITAAPYALSSGSDVPVGTILPWVPPAGATTLADVENELPVGYALCDGGESTDDTTTSFDERMIPDLLTGTSFLRGGAPNQAGETGTGSTTHDHGNVTGTTGGSNSNDDAEPQNGEDEEVAEDDHTHSFRASFGDPEPAAGPANDVVPPYYPVVFIIRVD